MVPLSQDHICLHVRANANYENSNLHIYQRPNFRPLQYPLLLPPQDNNVWQFTRKHYILLKIYDCNQDITNGEMSIRQNVNDYFLMKELHQVYKKENSEESGRWKKIPVVLQACRQSLSFLCVFHYQKSALEIHFNA